MSGKINQQDFARYFSSEVVDHLASNYVMGTLTTRVRNRVDALRNGFECRHINERILFWENRLSPLDEKTPELAPKAQTWQNIQAQLNMTPQVASGSVQETSKKFDWSSLFLYRWATAFSLMLVVIVGVAVMQKPEAVGNLSYVAVLADENQKPQVVAATYGDSQTLMLDILELPEVEEGESFELWVTSKTDRQTRSLGEIPIGQSSFNRQLTDAEWRLIKDSDSLLISIEEIGGSAMGEPTGEIVSSGLCIRLSAWQQQDQA
ncbi:MAG: hypothetical protein Alis3KO_15770 [Aliiglaciecola sp.]